MSDRETLSSKEKVSRRKKVVGSYSVPSRGGRSVCYTLECGHIAWKPASLGERKSLDCWRCRLS